MSASRLWPALAAAVLLGACSTSGSRPAATGDTTAVAHPRPPAGPAARRPAAPAARPRGPKPPVRALVTAETENRLLVVALPSGRLLRGLALPPDPEDLATSTPGDIAVVTSGSAGKVSLLKGPALRVVKVIGGFSTPHIVEITPDGRYAYVTDDSRGTLTVLDLAHRRVTSTLDVGAGAHHLSFDLVHRRAWVALGQSATTIVVLDVSKLAHPRVIGRFDPGFPAHDLQFSANGRQVWVSSAGGPDVSVFSPTNRRLLFQVPVGAPPQHIALSGRYAYLTSGYGSTIERVDAATGRILARTTVPYGSFELDARDGYVVTSSLLRGTLAIFTASLKLVRIVALAPVTREVAIWGGT